GVLLVLTYTRSAPIICLLIAPVLLYLLGGRRLAVIGALIGAIVVAGVVLRSGNFSARMLSLLSGADEQYGNRLEIWRWALHAFAHRPLTGVGPRNLQYFPGAPWADRFRGRREDNAENMYLNTLAEMGLLGLLAVLACLVGAGRRIVRGLNAGTT